MVTDPCTGPVPTTVNATGRAEERFDAATGALWRRLPRRVRGWVPQTFVGFAVLNGLTFGVDLALLAVLSEQVGTPHPVSISVAYAVALSLAFVLNRWLNFHVHGPVGHQAGRYVVVVSFNYTVLVLGVGGGLATLGVPVVLARMVAGLAEAVWMYAVMRWWVFRPRRGLRGGMESPESVTREG
jgi:putative flippase GtrA